MTTSSRRRHRPWQWDWKRPRWIRVADDDTADEARTPAPPNKSNVVWLSTSLQVSPSELPPPILQLLPDTIISAEESSADVAINTSFLCLEVHGWRRKNSTSPTQRRQRKKEEPSTTQRQGGGATEIQIQLLLIPTSSTDDEDEDDRTKDDKKQPAQSQCQTLIQTTLPWPASLLSNNNQDDVDGTENVSQEDTDNEPGWIRFWLLDGLLKHYYSKPKKAAADHSTSDDEEEESIITARLARKPPLSSQAQVTEAQETLALLSMLRDPLSTNDDEIEDDLTILEDEKKDEEGSDGNIVPPASSEQEQGDDMPIQLYLVTNTGHVLVYNPWDFLKSSKHQAEDPDVLTRGLAHLLFGTSIMEAVLYKSYLPLSQYEQEFRLSIMNRNHQFQTQWNVYLEPSSLHYATRCNRPVCSCITKDYLVIAGTGTRIPVEQDTKVDNKESPTREQQLGGFVTLVSLHYSCESTTCFLPFPPTHVATFDMPSEHDASADLDPIPGCVVWNQDKAFWIRLQPWFRLIPIQFSSIHSRILELSSTTPPVMTVLETVIYDDDDAVTAVIVQHRLGIKRQGGQIKMVTELMPGHVARIPLSTPSRSEDVWAFSGQGWSLLGTANRTYLVCWEGSTRLTGAGSVEQLPFEGKAQPCPIQPSIQGQYTVANMKLPFTQSYRMPSTVLRRQLASQKSSEDEVDFFNPSLPIARPSKRRSVSQTNLGLIMDDVVVDALESISGLHYRQDSSSIPASPNRRPRLSHVEKSQRLLKHCSSWNQLEFKAEHKQLLEEQMPLLRLMIIPPDPTIEDADNQLKELVATSHILSLRKIVVDNGAASPFQQVLAWLSNKQDFFTAASVALDLLRDADTLHHLWKYGEENMDHSDDELRKSLEGLLDGILPLEAESIVKGDASRMKKNYNEMMVQLADMTVGCFTRGGHSFAEPLNLFLQSNQFYDPARASLMLAATSSKTLSQDSEVVQKAMGTYDRLIVDSSPDSYLNDILWPVRCLLQIGVSRDYLEVVFLLLNSAVSDELRNRSRKGSSTSTAELPLELSLKLISLIVSSSNEATGLLLDLVDDDQSRCRFWQSLDHATKLEYSVLTLNSRCPLLRHAEVREWAREQLHTCLKNENVAGSSNVFETMPTSWLRRFTHSVLLNAGCSQEEFRLNQSRRSYTASHGHFDESKDSSESAFSLDADGLEDHKGKILETRKALHPLRATGGLDFDLLLPCLLILELRSEPCFDADYASTQLLLDEACYLAGRYNHEEEPAFPFDGATAMKQCFLAGNIRAGANLIGGKNGFILSCCEILITELGVTMDEAESFLTDEKIGASLVSTDIQSESKTAHEEEHSLFVLRGAHRRLLWLFDEHVLSVRTYGEFETTHIRGRVDPVFAARSIFRSWHSISISTTKQSSAWLVGWLRQKLGIAPGKVSPHRLVCAAIVRALVWSSNGRPSMEAVDSGQILGHEMCIEMPFLFEICQGCCGLVESVPPLVAESVLIESKMRHTENLSQNE